MMCMDRCMIVVCMDGCGRGMYGLICGLGVYRYMCSVWWMDMCGRSEVYVP